MRAASKPFSSTPKLAIIADKELMIYESLKKGEENFSYKVYIKEEFPEEFHYAANDNVQELIVVAKEGFAFAHDMRERIRHLDEMTKRKESLHNVSSFQLIFINLHLSHQFSGLWHFGIQQHL